MTIQQIWTTFKDSNSSAAEFAKRLFYSKFECQAAIKILVSSNLARLDDEKSCLIGEKLGLLTANIVNIEAILTQIVPAIDVVLVDGETIEGLYYKDWLEGPKVVQFVVERVKVNESPTPE